MFTGVIILYYQKKEVMAESNLTEVTDMELKLLPEFETTEPKTLQDMPKTGTYAERTEGTEGRKRRDDPSRYIGRIHEPGRHSKPIKHLKRFAGERTLVAHAPPMVLRKLKEVDMIEALEEHESIDLEDVATVQVMDNFREVQITMKTKADALRLHPMLLSVKDYPLQFEMDFTDRVNISLLGIPYEVHDHHVLDFIKEFAEPLRKPIYYPPLKRADGSKTSIRSGTRVVAVGLIRQHIPHRLKLFGKMVRIIYNGQPEADTFPPDYCRYSYGFGRETREESPEQSSEEEEEEEAPAPTQPMEQATESPDTSPKTEEHAVKKKKKKSKKRSREQHTDTEEEASKKVVSEDFDLTEEGAKRVLERCRDDQTLLGMLKARLASTIFRRLILCCYLYKGEKKRPQSTHPYIRIEPNLTHLYDYFADNWYHNSLSPVDALIDTVRACTPKDRKTLRDGLTELCGDSLG